MVSFKPRLTLSDLLLQPEVVEQLRDRFSHIQESLTTTIHEAADLTRLSEAQLRYAEARGLLAPSRAIGLGDAEAPTRGQRRYTVENLLRAHLIAFILDHGYSLSEIATFMENNSSIIHELIETTTLRLQPVLDAADAVLFKRFFVPRALYYALSLIFERDAVADAGIIFPVRATPAELRLIAPGKVETADDLIRLGHIVVAWRARGRPMSAFITAGNPFEREQQVRLKALSQLGVATTHERFAARGPVQAYIAYSPQSEPELLQAQRLLAIRHSPDRHGEASARRLANPHTVAARLIDYVQTHSCRDVAAIGQTETMLSDALFFNAPEMANPALGDALLNRLADTIVELGGASRDDPYAAPPELYGGEPPVESLTRWRFSCVLMPREADALLKRQELVVRAQSKHGPHRIGVTTTSPQLNGGLTFRAYSSGRVTYRPEINALDPAVSYVSEESPISSAIAAPAVDGQGMEHSNPPAVIYVASRHKSAFNDDDFLLIRVMGRLVGEIVQTYNSRGHLPNALTDALADPEIVDGFFADFLSELSFVTDLQKALKALKEQKAQQGLKLARPHWREDDQPPGDGGDLEDLEAFHRDIQTLTLVGVDVNDFSSIQQRQGERVARMLTREIGNRLKQRMNAGQVSGVPTTRLYRAWGDRYYLLMRDDDSEQARQRAERMRQDISGGYHLDGDAQLTLRRASGQEGANQAPGSISVGVRMARVALTQDELRAHLVRANGDVTICAASLSRLLEEGLQQANEASTNGERSVWWNAEHNAFESAKAS